ncbi:MAG: formylmethanofuran--tetrahydromethanopterin N-formyltransferase [Planctomycetaceae bacterium]
MPELRGVPIDDTFAEAFGVTGTRLIVTAATAEWAWTAATVATGNATSVIACDCEASPERRLDPHETPDGRPGVSILLFAFNRESLEKAVQARVGQSILTCPTTACYNGLLDAPADKRIGLGSGLRHFGDGYQISKQIGGRRYWRVPVMDGEFVCEDKAGTTKGVGGGNLLICGRDQTTALHAADAAAAAMRQVPGVILPFPGGIVRSGSKVGSKYKALKASTNDAWCPTLKGLVRSDLPPDCEAVYEIVIDGLSFDAVQQAMRVGLEAAVACEGVLKISAGNYGGKLGKHHFHLRDLLT